MSVNVTIHRGEIRQLKRFVENAKGKEAQGQLFGLWTHSFQPVIQFVTGPSTRGRRSGDLHVEEYMREKHALVHLGNWSTREKNGQFPANINHYELRLNINQGEKHLKIKSTFYDADTRKTEQGRLDKLPGQSAFRIFEPLTLAMKDMLGYDVSPLEAREDEGQSDDDDSTTDQVEVKAEQWYSTEEGMKLFGLIFGTLKENQFEVVETSRDVSSHDIRLTLRYQAREMRLEFPADFPNSRANVVRGASNNEAISVQESSSHKEMAQELCDNMKRLVTGKGGQRNKGGGRGNGDGKGNRGGAGGGRGRRRGEGGAAAGGGRGRGEEGGAQGGGRGKEGGAAGEGRGEEGGAAGGGRGEEGGAAGGGRGEEGGAAGRGDIGAGRMGKSSCV